MAAKKGGYHELSEVVTISGRGITGHRIRSWVWRPSHGCSAVRSAGSHSYAGPTASCANIHTGPATQYPNGDAVASGIRNRHASASAGAAEGED
jgi:hypothetical protein